MPISAYTVAFDNSVLNSVSSPSNRMGFCRSSNTFWILGSTVVDCVFADAFGATVDGVAVSVDILWVLGIRCTTSLLHTG